MFIPDVNSFLMDSKKVLYFSFVDVVYDDNNKVFDEKTILRLNTYHEDLFASKSAYGNCTLFSHDTILIEHLYHLCQLFRYDVDFEDFGTFAALQLIGCDGDCRLLGRSVFARVNGKRPEAIF